MGRQGVYLMGALHCFFSIVLLALSASLIALGAVEHSKFWTVWGTLWVLYGSYQITKEIYL